MNITDERKEAAAKSRARAVVKKETPKKAAGRASPARQAVAKSDLSLDESHMEVRFKKRKRVPVSAASLLGVKPGENGKTLTQREWVTVIRHGVHSTAVDAITGFLVVTKSEFSDAIDIPLRTLIRRKAEDLLPSDETAKLVRVARVIERAEEVFEDPDAARVWLKSANAALSGETPMSLLDTEIGAESVMDALGRIEYGVFA